MTTFANLFSVPTEIEFEGKKYKLRPPTLLEEGKYQRWMEQRARESVARATYLDEESRSRAENAITRDIAAGYYEFGGALTAEALQTKPGLVKLIELVCDIPEKEAARLVEFRLKIISELIRAKQADDPKAVRAALTTLGLPADFLKPKKGLSSAFSTRRSTKRKRKSRR